MSDEKSWQGWYLFDEDVRDNLYERCHELRDKDPVNETSLRASSVSPPPSA